MIYDNVLSMIGKMPLVRLDKVTRGIQATVLGKCEFMNPGGSVKDRPGLSMIEAAEREGRLKPGGTIVEATSGNTGVGLAIAASVKGYRMIFVIPDKMSEEKINLLSGKSMPLVIAARGERKAEVIQRMKEHGISQVPVVDDQGCCAGIVTESELLQHLFQQKHQEGETIADVMDQETATAVGADTPLSELTGVFGQQKVAVVVEDHRPVGIVTRIDLIDYLAVRIP
jgi:predicted transcriptional regulator